jgi:SP family myo-inositol transporter-like MFS transporter 13
MQAEDVELPRMTDAAAEPLISDTREYPSDAWYHEHEAGNVEEEEDSALLSPGLFIWGLTICAGVSGLLFGYE